MKFILLHLLVIAASLAAVAAFGQTNNTAPASTNILYIILNTNDASHVEVIGGYGVIPHSFRKYDTAERGPVAGIQADTLNHTFTTGNTLHVGPLWGVMTEATVTRNIIGLGASTDWVKFPNPFLAGLNWLQDQKDATPIVRAAPIQPAKLRTQFAIITPADTMKAGFEFSATIPMGK